MPNNQHHPWQTRAFHQGANKDTEDEFIGVQEGEYIDARNARPGDMGGDQASLKKISGEVLEFSNVNNACNATSSTPLTGDYICMYAIEVNDKTVSFWADKNDTEPSLVRIDGKIVLKSSGFPIKTSAPLQISKNESCVGGEVYITDFSAAPMIFNINDMLLNSNVGVGSSCTEKYFADFDIRKYTANLEIPPDHPQFTTLVDLGGGGGVALGSYQYSIRFVDSVGNRTQFSVSTPQIPVYRSGVPGVGGANSNEYPSTKTFTAPPEPGTPTNFGIAIKFRVTNILAFDSIEIERIRHVDGSPIGSDAERVLVYRVEIADNEIDVITFIDGATRTATDLSGATRGVTLPDDPVTIQTQLNVMSSIETAKSNRYYKQRLVLMNIKFASRDLSKTSLTFKQTLGDELFPVMENMGKNGHNDAFHHAYHKSYMDSEKFTFGVVGFDNRGDQSFVEPVPQGDNFQVPHRRDVASATSALFSYRGMSAAALVNGTTGNSFEVFDLNDAIKKDKQCSLGAGSFKNILDSGSKSRSKITEDGCADPGFGGTVTGSEIGYQPYSPTDQFDTDVAGHGYRVNVEVEIQNNAPVPYNPKAFGPNYYARGIALSGVENLPDWMQSFSVVRSEGAKRVVAQGLGFYSINEADLNFIGQASGANKEKNKFWFYSPDLDDGLSLDPTIADAIEANPGSYEIELVSPLGTFSEVYNGDIDPITRRDQLVDMITYPRILRDEDGANAKINPSEQTAIGIDGGDGFRYIAYGKWRNQDSQTSSKFPGNKASATSKVEAYPLTDFTPKTEGRGIYYELEVDPSNSFYNNQFNGGSKQFNNQDVRDWHEPMYIVNIVQTGKTVANSNINEFIETGHYQKVNAIIGQGEGTGVDQIFELVDERWEDCISALDASHTLASDDRLVFVEDATLSERAWLNVTFKSAGEITTILTDLQTTGVHITTGGINIYGVYTHTNSNDREFNLIFAQFDTNFDAKFFRPETAAFIRVKYNPDVPIRFFGGDSFIGESIFAPIDGESNENSDIIKGFQLNTGFPYFTYNINHRHYVVKRTTGIDKIQDRRDIKLVTLRQMCAMFTCESRLPLHLFFNNPSFPGSFSNALFFPMVNYIMRPHQWKTDKTPSQQNIFSDYETDYPDEMSIWGRGGFRFIPNGNIDYSKPPLTKLLLSTPTFGFNEENEFCTRVIWSLERGVNVVDSPGVKTFPVLNARDISDDSGEIKFAWDADGGKTGSNLYAFTDSGICLLLTDKLTLSQKSGDELALIGTDDPAFIQEEKWLSRTIGMNDEMWRGVAEWDNTIYFPNKTSIYSFENNVLKDILRLKYHSRVYPEHLRNFLPGFDQTLTGVYDEHHNEYWIQFGDLPINRILQGQAVNIGFTPNKTGEIIKVLMQPAGLDVILQPVQTPTAEKFFLCADPASFSFTVKCAQQAGDTTFDTLQPGECLEFTLIQPVPDATQCQYTARKVELNTTGALFAFNELTQHWNGEYDYRFDQYMSFQNQMFGFRDLEAYELNEGLVISGSPIVFQADQVANPEQMWGKEFIRFRAASNVKPTRVEFRDELGQAVQAELDPSQGALYLKDYDGFEQYIPRRLAGDRNRMQGRVLIYRIIHDASEEFKIADSAIQYKKLK